MKINFNYRPHYILISFTILSFLLLVSCEKEDALKMNQIQLLGSHNSYKQRIQKELWDMMYSKRLYSSHGIRLRACVFNQSIKFRT